MRNGPTPCSSRCARSSGEASDASHPRRVGWSSRRDRPRSDPHRARRHVARRGGRGLRQDDDARRSDARSSGGRKGLPREPRRRHVHAKGGIPSETPVPDRPRSVGPERDRSRPQEAHRGGARCARSPHSRHDRLLLRAPALGAASRSGNRPCRAPGRAAGGGALSRPDVPRVRRHARGRSQPRRRPLPARRHDERARGQLRALRRIPRRRPRRRGPARAPRLFARATGN